MENIREKIKLKLKEVDVTNAKNVVYTDKADVKDVQDKVKPGTEIHIVDKQDAAKFNSGALGMKEAEGDGVTTVIDDTKPDSSPDKEVNAKMTTADAKTTGFSNKKEDNAMNADEANKIVAKFIKAIDKSPMAVTSAKQLKTPNLKLQAGVELIKKLRIPKNYLNRLKGLMATAVVQEMESELGAIITEATNPNDGQLSVGELKQALEILRKSKNKDEAIAKAKSAGADVAKLVLGLIPVIGNVAGTGLGLLDIFKKVMDPKNPKEKNPNEFIQLFQIDPEVSKLLDDEIEYKFIAYAEEGLKKMSDDKPVPDFFNELQKFIKQNYANAHNVTKTTESVNPKMKKKDLMELIQSSNKLKVVERIKVKDLKR
jgi:hypothetical protein